MGQSLIVNRATLVVAWDTARFPQMSVPRIQDRETAISNLSEMLQSRGLVVEPSGPIDAPSWEVAHAGQKAIGIVPLNDLASLSGVEDQLALEALLVIYDKDLSATDEETTVSVQPEDDPEPIRRPDGQSLGANKRKVLKAIAISSLKAVPGQGPGSAVFARSRIRFKTR